MSRATLVAVEYASEPDAERALGILRDLSDEDALDLHDAAVVVKHADGRVELRQSRELAAGEGAVGGGSIGFCSACSGSPRRRCTGRRRGRDGFAAHDREISNKEMRHVCRALARRGAALRARGRGRVGAARVASRAGRRNARQVGSVRRGARAARPGTSLARAGFCDRVVQPDRAHDLGAGRDHAGRADDRAIATSVPRTLSRSSSLSSAAPRCRSHETADPSTATRAAI